MRLETKRIAPGEKNTWVIEVDGTEGSIAYSTKQPKTLRTMAYEPGREQEWRVTDLGYESAQPRHHRVDLRVRLLGRRAADVGGVLRRARPRPRGDAPTVPLCDARGGAATHRPFTAALRSQEERAVVLV